MEITIKNFKAIKSLDNYELKPITILSGTNSSGKSSFIQLLLLLKQTIKESAENKHLFLNGDFYKVREFIDIIRKKDLNSKLKIGFKFDKKEICHFDDEVTELANSFETYNCYIELIFDYYNNKEYIAEFLINYSIPELKELYIKFTQNKQTGECNIDTNSKLFSKDIFDNTMNLKFTKIAYTSIFPQYYETFNFENNVTERNLAKLDGVKLIITNLFDNLFYIGPIREEPKDEYFIKLENFDVGSKGENVAQILEIYKDKIIQFNRPEIIENGFTFHKVELTLLEGVKYWLCDIFNISKDLKTTKVEDRYTITLVNDADLQVTLKHVGFGISQILPIIVQGLLMPTHSTLILEQPEIHLHPKLQSLLFDFLYSLTLSGKSIIVETHSDHFITRLRRRVAEDETNTLHNKINLTFIENKQGEVLFRSLDMDDCGTFTYFPDNFMVQTNIEMRAIVKAQTKKRSKKL